MLIGVGHLGQQPVITHNDAMQAQQQAQAAHAAQITANYLANRGPITPDTGLPFTGSVSPANDYAAQAAALQQQGNQYKMTQQQANAIADWAASQPGFMPAAPAPTILQTAARVEYCGPGCARYYDAAGNVIGQIGPS